MPRKEAPERSKIDLTEEDAVRTEEAKATVRQYIDDLRKAIKRLQRRLDDELDGQR
jgi:hypothetical protein